MSVVVYSGESPASIRQIESVVEQVAPEHRVSVCRDLRALRRRLYGSRENLRIAILKAADRNELEGLVLLRDLLSDIRIVLIVPDQDEITVSLAHRLRPRFLARADGDWDEIRMVLGNMIRFYR
jgi:hypothetical protein